MKHIKRITRDVLEATPIQLVALDGRYFIGPVIAFTISLADTASTEKTIVRYFQADNDLNELISVKDYTNLETFFKIRNGSLKSYKNLTDAYMHIIESDASYTNTSKKFTLQFHESAELMRTCLLILRDTEMKAFFSTQNSDENDIDKFVRNMPEISSDELFLLHCVRGHRHEKAYHPISGLQIIGSTSNSLRFFSPIEKLNNINPQNQNRNKRPLEADSDCMIKSSQEPEFKRPALPVSPRQRLGITNYNVVSRREEQSDLNVTPTSLLVTTRTTPMKLSSLTDTQVVRAELTSPFNNPGTYIGCKTFHAGDNLITEEARIRPYSDTEDFRDEDPNKSFKIWAVPRKP